MKQYSQHITPNYFEFRSPSSLYVLCSDEDFKYNKEIYYDDIS